MLFLATPENSPFFLKPRSHFLNCLPMSKISFFFNMFSKFLLNFLDNFFNKVEKKTNVKKSTILDLAKKLQGDNMKNEDNIRDVIRELSKMTGKEVSKEQEDKIINTIGTIIIYSPF